MVENLSVAASTKYLSNQWTLPVLAGIKDPEMCSISSSKLQKLTKSKHLQDLYRVMYNG